MPRQAQKHLLTVVTNLLGAGSFMRSALRGIHAYTQESGRWILRLLPWDFRPGRLTAWVPHGLILLPHDAQHLRRIRKTIGRRVPIVSVSTNWIRRGVGVVCPDDQAIGRLAAEHLLSLGLRHFACLGYPIPGYSTSRQLAFCRLLAARGFRCARYRWQLGPPELIHETSMNPDLRSWVASLPKPVGIFAVNDHLAWELSELCHMAGFAIPDQVALIGVDNDEILCEISWPPLSSVNVPGMRVGYAAAALLGRMMNGAPPPSKPIRIPPLGVATRHSTNLLAVDDPHVARALRFVRDRLGHKITVRDVAAIAGVGRRTLERRFKEILGRSIPEEIRRARIESACRLLATTHRKVQDIAESLGFPYPQRFYSQFRRAMGLSPAKWRRQAQFRLPAPPPHKA